MADPSENPRRVIARIVGSCSAYSLLTTFIVLLLGIASGSYATRHLSIETDMTRLISPQVAWRQNEEALDRAFPQDADLIAAVVEAPSDALAAEAADALAQRLKVRSDLFHDVREPDGGAFLRREGLLLLSLEQVDKTTERLSQSYPLFAALTRDPSLRGLLGFIRLAIDGVLGQQAAAEEVLPLLDILSSGCSAVLTAPPGTPVPPLDWETEAEHKPPKAHRRFVLAQSIPHEESDGPSRPFLGVCAGGRT